MEAISFKVTSKGVHVNLNPDSNYNDIKNAFLKHTSEASNFFTGVELYINLNGRIFSAEEMKELIEILSRYENIGQLYFFNQELKNKSKTMDTILINRTIRSGQRIKYPANIVVIGDINPGAEVIAGGDILVIGKLKGVVHAGAAGSNESQIIALKLQPTQLRIGHFISRSPDEVKDMEPSVPERAYVKDGMIIVETLKLWKFDSVIHKGGNLYGR